MNALMVIGLCLMLPFVITLFICSVADIVKAMKDPLYRIIAVLIMFAICIFGFVLVSISL
jgi:hypothetical protein